MKTRTGPSKAGSRVIEAFQQAVERLPELGPGRRLMLGCSAGGDSMTLLDLAARFAPQQRWTLSIVHLDHRQRPESAEEARFLTGRALHYGLPIFIEHLSDELVATSPLSEDVMRQARHECFARFARIWEADAIALAHQADDRAETFVIRLLAGSGPTGLASIRPAETVAGLRLVRPLLSVRREEMRDYLEAGGLPWRDDPSNLDLATKRGWVRHTLLPLIHEHIGLDPTARIVRAAQLVEDEAAVTSEAVALLLETLTARGENGSPIRARLDMAHPLWRRAGGLLRRQLVRQWLWELRPGPHPPGFAPLNEALVFIERAAPGAHLRTIDMMHLVHARDSVLAFEPHVEEAARREAAAAYLPAPRHPKKKKPGA